MPNGVYLIEEFISEEEEQFLLNALPKTDTKSKTNRSLIQRYGSAVYGSLIVSSELPEYLSFVTQRIVDKKLLEDLPKHLTINRYNKGDFIRPHIDNKRSGPVITVLSLENEATMVLSLNGEKEIIILPPRSIVQLKDEARTKWKHEILPVSDIRYSIVFRD